MPKQIAPTAKLENYKRIEKVGEGTYGVVYKAIYIPSKKEVALKKIRLEGEDEECGLKFSRFLKNGQFFVNFSPKIVKKLSRKDILQFW